MAEYRRASRPRLEAVAAGGVVIGVTPTGHLQWITPDPSPALTEAEHAAAQPALGAQVISDQERALVEANRQRIEQLKTLPYPSPDLHDIVAKLIQASRLRSS
jgi:hypothetical protein